MRSSIDEDKLKEIFKTGDGSKRPLSFREIEDRIKPKSPDRKKLRTMLNAMVSEGAIVKNRRGLYGPAEEMNLVTGTFDSFRDGFGFVIPDAPGTPDVFIPPRKVSGAMGGDRVIARVEDKGKRDGRVVRILERAHTRVSGVIELTRTACFLKPKRKDMPYDIYIPPSGRGKAKNGETVLAEITGYPSQNRLAEAKVLKVLQPPKSPREDIDTVVEEFGLTAEFPREVLRDAKECYNLGIDKRRKDLRGMVTFTIDGERAKDFDDAVSAVKTGEGYVLYVHIADVGYYVGWDTPLDLEARRRATSVYFPDRVVPMLPPALSEDLCSLRPNEDRPAFTAEILLDKNGAKTGARFYPSVIKSRERLTYTSVRKVLVDLDPVERARYEAIVPDLELLAEIARLLKAKMKKRGSLDFDLPEPEILLDLTGAPEAIIRAERNFAHEIIEVSMIAANEAVAERLREMGVPSLYRVHEPPDERKLGELFEKLSPFMPGFKPAKVIRRVHPSMLPKALEYARGRPEEEAVSYMILRSLKQARYLHANAGHFGLGSECYTHFTSPIRRYPDLVVHRILRESLREKGVHERRLKELSETLPGIAVHSSRLERNSDEAERTAADAMRVWFMRDRVGEEFPARVVGVSTYGIKVRLKEYYVEGFIHVSFLTDDYYEFDAKLQRLSGRNRKRAFAFGTELSLRIDRVDMEAREIIFGIL